MENANTSGSWADTGAMAANENNGKSSSELLEELLNDESLDARRSIDLLLQFMLPGGSR